MKGFEAGIPYYTALTTPVTVHFPVDAVHCQYCNLFCRYEESFKRYSCRLTGEWLLDPFHDTGDKCPLRGGSHETTK